MNRSTTLFRSSFLITVLSLLGISFGLVTQIFLARWFGAGIELDAYFAASSLPNLITLVLTGSLNVVIVPLFLTYQARNSVEEAWQIAGSLFNLLVVLLVFLSLSGVLLAPWIIRVLVPGYGPSSLNYHLALSMFRIQWPIILFSGVAGILSGVFYAHGRFARPAAAPAIYSGCTLFFTLALHRQLGIVSTAVGSLAGPVVHSALLLPILIGNPHYRFTIDWRNPGLREAGRLIMPWVAGNAAGKASGVLDTVLTSNLPAGSLAYLNYGNRLVSLTVNLISRGTALSVFPRISRSWAESDSEGFRLYFSTGMRFVGLLAIPATGSLIVLRETLVRLLFERGLFSTADTAATGLAVALYACALASLAFGSIVSNAFYARHDTATPAVVSVVGIFLQAGLAFILLPYLSFLAMAVAFAVLTNLKLGVMVYMLWRQGQPLDGRRVTVSLVRMVLATAAMCLWLLASLSWVETATSTDLGLVAALLLVGTVAVVVYVSALLLLNSPELAILTKRFRKLVAANGSMHGT